MLEFDFPRFVVLVRELVETEQRYHRALQGREAEPPRPDPADKPWLEVRLGEIVTVAGLLGLDVTVARARDFINRLNREDLGMPDVREGEARLGEVRRTIEDGLQGNRFMYFPSDDLLYYTESALFGGEVENKLPDVSADIAEAGRCRACGRDTATVFHLMRVMETGVREFGRSLGVPINPRDLWDAILRQANTAIQALPRATDQERERRSAYEQLYAALQAVRVAWRNPTMHGVERSYTAEESREVWDCTRTFMRRLAAVLP
jgi:hypothetical protein